MVVPGASGDESMRCAVGRDEVTAMVSPCARPGPAYSTEHGRVSPRTVMTTCQITSQVGWPPRPCLLASIRPARLEHCASREMNGMTMIASTQARGELPMP